MKSATPQQLVETFNKNADAVRSLEMKMSLTFSRGGPRVGVVKTYKTTLGTYLYIQKPSNIRFFGNFTALGKVFDMVSDGDEFEVSYITGSRFYTGHIDAPPAKDATDIEKMRPSVILDSMLINPIRINDGDHVVPVNDRAETNAEYGLLVHRPSADGYDHVLRRIVISRYNLLPVRQIIYDQKGFQATTVTYDKYVDVNGVPVPTKIRINRPVEEYTLDFTVDPSHILINPPDRPTDFWQLTPPAGYKVIDLDGLASAAGGVRPR